MQYFPVVHVCKWYINWFIIKPDHDWQVAAPNFLIV